MSLDVVPDPDGSRPLIAPLILSVNPPIAPPTPAASAPRPNPPPPACCDLGVAVVGCSPGKVANANPAGFFPVNISGSFPVLATLSNIPNPSDNMLALVTFLAFLANAAAPLAVLKSPKGVVLPAVPNTSPIPGIIPPGPNILLLPPPNMLKGPGVLS